MTASAPMVERTTRLGRVRGVRRIGVETYWGLRFAEPVERFRAPKPATAWQGVYDARSRKPMCPQALSNLDVFPAAEGGYDEDCLFLNVHVPAEALRPLPVLVWIHGGAMTGGAANQYDGSTLALGADAVVVCINYRLAMFGFFDMSRFGREFEGSAENWLKDQIEALRWVRDNIADYGGDPSLVTIVGESAGATSVLSLHAAPAARGLFHRAVACSGGPLALEPAPDQLPLVMKAKRLTQEQARDWLLTAPATELVKLQEKVRPLGPTHVAGSPMLPRLLPQLIGQQGAAAAPLIVGYTTHEGDLLDWATSLQLKLRWPLQPLVLHLIARYVAQRTAGGKAHRARYLRRLRRSHRTLIGRRLNDLVWTDSARKAAVDHALATTSAGSRGYVYELDLPMTIGGVQLRSTHGVDIALTFNPFDDPDADVPPMSSHPRSAELAREWQAMLGRFARSGDPTWDWPPYDEHHRSVLLVSAEGNRLLHDPDPVFRTKVWQS